MTRRAPRELRPHTSYSGLPATIGQVRWMYRTTDAADPGREVADLTDTDTPYGAPGQPKRPQGFNPLCEVALLLLQDGFQILTWEQDVNLERLMHEDYDYLRDLVTEVEPRGWTPAHDEHWTSDELVSWAAYSQRCRDRFQKVLAPYRGQGFDITYRPPTFADVDHALDAGYVVLIAVDSGDTGTVGTTPVAVLYGRDSDIYQVYAPNPGTTSTLQTWRRTYLESAWIRQYAAAYGKNVS